MRRLTLLVVVAATWSWLSGCAGDDDAGGQTAPDAADVEQLLDAGPGDAITDAQDKQDASDDTAAQDTAADSVEPPDSAQDTSNPQDTADTGTPDAGPTDIGDDSGIADVTDAGPTDIGEDGGADVADIGDDAADSGPTDTGPDSVDATPDDVGQDTGGPDVPDVGEPDVPPPPEACFNGVDDDEDGLADCLDDECAAEPGCDGATCATALVAQLPGVWTTQIAAPASLGDTIAGSCGGAGSADAFILLDLAVATDVLLQVSPDATLMAFAGCDGAEVACATGGSLALPAATGALVLVVDTGSFAPVDVTITATPVGIDTSKKASEDPLLFMPGTQPEEITEIQSSETCLACHAGYAPGAEPGHGWKGSMMGQAARDPLYWASYAVAVQDSVWILGDAGAGDLCLRCHTPPGWLAGRSHPATGTSLKGADYDGVSCDFCHRMVDPFHVQTHAGVREGDDWLGVWDETGLSSTPSQAAADATLALDKDELGEIEAFSGEHYFDGTSQPPATWTENSGGQYFVADDTTRRGQLADAKGGHPRHYSRYHKSRYFCSTCHDVSDPVLPNLAFAGAVKGDGATVLPSETLPAFAWGHVERTFSEFMLSDYAADGGAPGEGPFAPGAFDTALPGDQIGRCQDCHMATQSGKASVLPIAILRPDASTEHPKTGISDHDLAGGNVWVPHLLATVVPGSPVWDPVNADLLATGTLAATSLKAGTALDAQALLDAGAHALQNLKMAASLIDLTVTPGTGAVSLRVRNNTGHKLISGFPEGRRMWLEVTAWQGETMTWHLNPYDEDASTLRGLDHPSSPALQAGEVHDDALVYEIHMASDLLGEEKTLHFVLGTHRSKDNRIPPKGFRIQDAAARICEPVHDGAVAPGLYTAAEYAGGYDQVALSVPPGATRVVARLWYQTTSREYVEFLRDEVNGAPTLPSPTASGRALAAVLQTDPALSHLAGLGDLIWKLWDHNRTLPGATPILMAEGEWTN